MTEEPDEVVRSGDAEPDYMRVKFLGERTNYIANLLACERDVWVVHSVLRDDIQDPRIFF